MSARALRSELLRTRLSRFTRVLHGVEHGEIRSVHRARVASRRLRELIPVLQLDGDVTRKFSRRLRQVTMQLGGMREIDVLMAIIDELCDARPNLAGALRRVAASVSKQRDEARKRPSLPQKVAEMKRVGRKLRRALDELKASEKPAERSKALRWAVDARVVHRANRLHEAIARAGAVYLPERLHAVRITLKKFRYALELSADLSGQKKATPTFGTLRRSQDVLGRMHDLQVLIDRVRDMQASLAPPNVAIWRELDALVVTLEDDCRRLHARYLRDSVLLSSITHKLAARPLVASSSRRAG